MVKRVTFEVKGLKELGERMRGLSTEMKLKIGRSATGSAARLIKDLAVENIRTSPSVETRKLLDNVIVKRLPDSEAEYTSEHIVTVRWSEAPHAHLIEWGTVNMPAEPYMTPAFDQGKIRAADVMRNTIKGNLKKANV